MPKRNTHPRFRVHGLSVLVACKSFVTPPLHAGSSSSCTLTVNFCSFTSDDDAKDRVVIRAYDGDDFAHVIASDEAVVRLGSSGSVTCNHNSACDITAEIYHTLEMASTPHEYSCDATVYLAAELVNVENADSWEANYDFSTAACP